MIFLNGGLGSSVAARIGVSARMLASALCCWSGSVGRCHRSGRTHLPGACLSSPPSHHANPITHTVPIQSHTCLDHGQVRVKTVVHIVRVTVELGLVQTVAINKRISQFYDVVGGCERLYRQPIPSSYTRYTSYTTHPEAIISMVACTDPYAGCTTDNVTT